METLYHTCIILLLTVLAWKVVPDPDVGQTARIPQPAGFLPTLSAFLIRAGLAAFVTGAWFELLWLALAGIAVMLSASGLLLLEKWRTTGTHW